MPKERKVQSRGIFLLVALSCMLVCALMLCSALSVPDDAVADAAEGQATLAATDDENVTYISTAKQLRQAFDNPNSQDAHYALANDIEYTEEVGYIPLGYSVTLDLNGYSIVAMESRIHSAIGDSIALVMVDKCASLTLVSSRLESGNVISGFKSAGAIICNGNLTIKGLDGTKVKIRDCANTVNADDRGGAITVVPGNEGPDPEIEISGALISDCTSCGHGGALYLSDQHAKITNTFIEKCSAVQSGGSAGDGGAIYLAAGTLEFDGSINSCHADGSGGALYVSDAWHVKGRVSVSGKIKSCDAASYGAAMAFAANEANVEATIGTSTTITECWGPLGVVSLVGKEANVEVTCQGTIGTEDRPNRGESSYGAVYVGARSVFTAQEATLCGSDGSEKGSCLVVEEGGEARLAKTTVSPLQDGSVLTGGAIYNKGTISLDGCTVYGSVSDIGGAIYQEKGSLTATNASTFTACFCAGNDHCLGGMAYVCGGDMTFDGCSFSNIEADGRGSLLYVTGSAGTLKFTNCTMDGASDIGAPQEGGCVYEDAAEALVKFDNCTVSNFRASHAGGLAYKTAGSMVVENTTISGMSAQTGALVYGPGSGITLNTCEISDATASNGEVIFVIDAGATLVKCTFSNCQTGNNGGIIFLQNGTATMRDLVFADVASVSSGPAIDIINSKAYLVGCTFTNCTTSNTGGAILVTGGSVSLDECTFTNCQATGNSGCGGAIYANGASIAAKNSVFTGCSASYEGGCIDCRDSDLGMDSCTISDAKAGSHGGAIYYDNTKAGGVINLKNCNFSECSADTGGCVYQTNGVADLTGTSFKNCSSKGSMGVYVFCRHYETPDGYVKIADGVPTFEGCTGDGYERNGITYRHSSQESQEICPFECNVKDASSVVNLYFALDYLKDSVVLAHTNVEDAVEVKLISNPHLWTVENKYDAASSCYVITAVYSSRSGQTVTPGATSGETSPTSSAGGNSSSEASVSAASGSTGAAASSGSSVSGAVAATGDNTWYIAASACLIAMACLCALAAVTIRRGKKPSQRSSEKE